jgi:transaldolase
VHKIIEELKIKIFADGADLTNMRRLTKNPIIKGFTTNPTLMRKSGIEDYAAFAKEVVAAIPNHPVSFEVFADELTHMFEQAKKIASWGENVNVKIPITNTKGEQTTSVIEALSKEGIQVNVTAVFTIDQVRAITDVLHEDTSAIVSVFAGRIADTGIDPVPLMNEAAAILANKPKAELLWASPRELFNIFHAESSGTHIITVAHDLLEKMSLIGKDLSQYSLETVQMFYKDALNAEYSIS